MNQIIRNYLKEHIEEYELKKYSEEKAFEHFINKCIVSRYSADRFDPDDVMTDEGEIGLDGIAILINQQLVLTIEDAKKILQSEQEIRVDFVFIQTKTSENFKLPEMSTFIRGVHFFFQESDRPHTNDQIENLIGIKDYIYSQITDQEHRPYLSLYYVCCGNWNTDNNLQEVVNSDKKNFLKSGIFEDVNYYTFDQDDIRGIYNEMRRKVKKVFTMEKHMAFPSMPGIKVAYFGLIRCKDLVRLLKDESGNLYPNIFEDNVRDFQGYNTVNTEIRNTIEVPDEQRKFAILNNGITIVAGDVKFNGDEATIFDYQIVNGCQTSRVLADHEDLLSDNSYVSAKIIQVSDVNVLNSIVFTTNRQTEVKSEAFVSAKPFHKKLEEYYNSVEPQYRLYYERRSKQYDMDSSIKKRKIVSLAGQTYAYVAMFLNEPHSVHRYFGELLTAYSNRLYGKDDFPEAYYVAAYYFYIIDNLFKQGSLDRELSAYKYQLCYIMRGLVGDTKLYQSSNKKLKKQAVDMIELSHNDAEFKLKLNTACTILKDSLKEYSTEEKIKSSNAGVTPDRTKSLTEIITKHIQDYTHEALNTHFLKKGDVVTCLVVAINPHNVNVELKTDDVRRKGSIHIKNINGRYIRNIDDYFHIGEFLQAKIISDNYEQSDFGWSLSTRKDGDSYAK